MKKAIVPIAFILIVVTLGAFLVTTEYRKRAKDAPAEVPETEEIVSLDDLQAADTAVLVEKNIEEKKLRLRHLGSTEDYELSYDATVPFQNKYGNGITVSELKNGEVLDIIYSKHSGQIISVKVSTQNWTMTEMTDYMIDTTKKMITIMGETYQYGPDLLAFSDDQQMRLMDITEMDTLTIKGYNRKVCSIILDEGHGYLRIKNDAYFIGGWIEVGQKIIRPITEEMLLPVPEGRYKVRVTNRGYAGEENVIIKRDEETVLDLAGIEVEEVAIGHVEFNLTPDYAQLYVDGEITDYEERVALAFGTHKIKVEAAGYQSVETNIKIGDDYANIEISLDPLPEDEQENEVSDAEKAPPVSAQPTPAGATQDDPGPDTSLQNTGIQNETAGDDALTTISGVKKIYVESPRDVEVYLDGNYIGVSPASTGKVTGAHTITLSKTGYITKSYTIYVENDNNDVTLSFSELLEE